MLSGVGDHHGPAPGGLVPEDLRVAELVGADVQDRIPVVVQVPGAALVRGVGPGLGLVTADIGAPEVFLVSMTAEPENTPYWEVCGIATPSSCQWTRSLETAWPQDMLPQSEPSGLYW